MIGIFDSGLGGLTVARNIRRLLPEHDFFYFGDTARSPYGNKSPKTLIQYSIQGADFLIKNGAKALVIACNSTVSVAFESLMEKTDIPIFDVVSPAVKLAIQVSKKLRFGVIGTRATVESGVYEKKIKEISPDVKVYSRACPLLIPLVEEGWLKKPEARMIVKKCVHPLKVRQIDTLILGCNQYAVLTKIIRTKIGKRVEIIDSSNAVAENLKEFLENHPEIDNLLEKNGRSRFFVSDMTKWAESAAKAIFKGTIHLEHVQL